MSIFDTILDLGGKAVGWADRNSDTIGKVIEGGRKVYNAYDASQTRQQSRSEIANLYQKMMDQQAQYGDEYQAWQESQLATQNANSRARASAAAATDRNRRDAAKGALDVQKKMLAKLQEGYAPYVEAARAITPKATANYNQFLDTTGLLNQYLMPSVMKNLSEPLAPASSINVPRPAVRLSQPSTSGVDPQQLIQQLLGAK